MTPPTTSSSKMQSRPEWDLLLSASMKNNVKEIERLITQCGVSPDHCNGACSQVQKKEPKSIPPSSVVGTLLFFSLNRHATFFILNFFQVQVRRPYI